jgi:hypothetical protein
MPDFENAETFVARLANAGVIQRDTAVGPRCMANPSRCRVVPRNGIPVRDRHDLPPRCDRSNARRHATNLLRDGVAISDTVHEAGYFDQAHLTRSLKSLIGLTPSKIAREDQQLSFLYKTTPPD